ncbi:sulfotransferase family protein [Novosphingobium sp.]|uniref:sulfotransferase family protein n=1 Tax=Novosphingobium sp. TaxID=1874826 RepID=UPI003B5249BA
MHDTIDLFIDDMADPVMTPALQAARNGPADFPDHLSLDELLKRATAEANGLSDFGDDEFRERMTIILQSWDEDQGLTRGGRIVLLQHAVKVMANRLMIEDLVKRHPEILNIAIDRPIIIAGLPRSGTTHLVNWLARDTRLRSLELWEAEEPVPMQPASPGQPDPRIAKTAALWGSFGALVPHLAAMHGMEVSLIEEDNDCMYMDGLGQNWEWQARMPRWIDYYLAIDRTPCFRYEKKVLQVMTWLRGPNRWLLKAPHHMENLAPLKAVFPDATMVITHRDPIAVLRSLTTMLGYCDRTRRDPVDPPGLARLWIDRIEALLRGCIAQRDAWGADQSIDLMFHDYMADQETVMRRIYAMSGLDLTPDVEASLDAYLNDNPRHKHGKVIYDLEHTFDVDVAALRDRFAFYYERFPVKYEG